MNKYFIFGCRMLMLCMMSALIGGLGFVGLHYGIQTLQSSAPLDLEAKIVFIFMALGICFLQVVNALYFIFNINLFALVSGDEQ